MPLEWKIELNSVDITDKVSGFEISPSLERFCREVTIGIIDKDTYDALDFSQISESPEIEIFTKTADTWYSQGTFFIERPAFVTNVKSDVMQGVWGRSLTAMLDEPFAPKVTKVWETKTTFFAICEEVCDLAGFTWDTAYSDISDFVIYPYTYEAEGLYPIQVITELATLAGALVTTDRSGHLCIKQVDYDPSSEDVTITDADISIINEKPEWPTFANRVRITPSGSLASHDVELIIPNECLHADGTSKTKMFAQVRDTDGNPVNGIIVDWSHDSDTASLSYTETRTQEILVQNEKQQSTGFYTVDVDILPSEVDGIWAYSDKRKSVNFTSGGYSIDGKTITLTDKLDYCDQSLVISYRAAGMAINYLQSGSNAEDVTVIADVEGQQDDGTVYIENQCVCPATIMLKANPSSITINEISKLLVYVEESGPIATGQMVYMRESGDTEHGELGWTRARLGEVSVTNEKTSARNEIAGVTQCEVSMYPLSIASVYKADDDGKPIGGNLYSSHDGKTVDLTTSLDTGTDLLVNYTALGAALNLFTGEVPGEAELIAHINTTSEEGAEASADVTITDYEPDNYEDDEDDEDYDGYGGSGGYGGYGFDTGPDEERLCRQSNGTRVECQEGERCCSDGYTVGCHPDDECVGGNIDPCYPRHINEEMDDEALDSRFDAGYMAGCTCEEMCLNEFEVYETTQSYDDASVRKISEIVVEDYGLEEGTPEYWEKYDELKAEALEQCENECECAVLEWDDENSPETITPDGAVNVFVTGGGGPFTWSIEGKGYSLLYLETETGQNQVSCVDGSCGEDFDPTVTITVTNSCGNEASGTLRNTAGQWTNMERAYATGSGCPCNTQIDYCTYNAYYFGKWKEDYYSTCCTVTYPICDTEMNCVEKIWTEVSSGHVPHYSPADEIHLCEKCAFWSNEYQKYCYYTTFIKGVDIWEWGC